MCNHEDVVDEAVRLIGDGGGDVLAYDLARAGEAPRLAFGTPQFYPKLVSRCDC